MSLTLASRTGFTINAKADSSADIFIYEDIGDGWMGGISAKRFADDLNALGKLDTLNVFVNSPGGSVFDGEAIYNVLKRNSARVVMNVDGLAASIASLIVMAGDEINIAANAMMMVHNPWTLVAGSADDLRATADMMDKLRDGLIATYAARTKTDAAKIGDMMTAETWMNADEAVALGFADKKSEEMKVAAHFDMTKFNFKNVPPHLAAGPSIPSLRDRIADGMMFVRQQRRL